MKWSGKKFDDIELNLDEPGLVFKAQLFALTGVEPDRQKIIVKGGMLKVKRAKITILGFRADCWLFDRQTLMNFVTKG